MQLFSKTGITLFLLLLFVGIAGLSQQDQIPQVVSFLASDELAGRQTGTLGEHLASVYISEQYRKGGFSKIDTSYFQHFEASLKDNPHTENSRKVNSKNVIGLIDNAGNDIIIIGAHYDHLGYGETGSLHSGDPAIHNGADDNASGVAVMIDAASKLKTNADILLIAFSGEEYGLLGSNYFCKNPVVNLSKAKAMINLDMVGRLNEERTLRVSGSGTAAEWDSILTKANSNDLNLISDPSGFGPSDHTSFYLQDIPVLHLFTGQHEDYHKPSDDAEKLNYEGMATISAFLQNIILEIDAFDTLTFQKTADSTNTKVNFKVTLGVIPDYLFSGEGMRIDGVKENRPAAKAGIIKGDTVIKMGKFEVRSMMEYMQALSKFKEGESTTVTVLREGNPVTVDLTFD